MKIMIRYGDGPMAGNGHRVRMQRLAKVLGQRGAEVNIRSANFVEMLDSLKRTPYDVLVMDVPENNNRELEAYRPHIEKLAVIVGAGHAVDTETTWIADAVVYQHMGHGRRAWRAPGGKVVGGPDWLLVDPASRDWRRPRSEIGSELLVYFGAGFADDYQKACLHELVKHLGPAAIVPTGSDGTWREQWARRAAEARLVLASQGMAIYEALAVNTPVVSVSIDEEHAQDAEASILIDHAGMYADIDPEHLTQVAVDKYGQITKRPSSPIDCAGVYRLARLLLE